MADIIKNAKQIVNNTLDNALEVGTSFVRGVTDDVVNWVNGLTTLEQQFINTRDFYNFIKYKSGVNSPTESWFFSVSFFTHNEELHSLKDEKLLSYRKNSFLKEYATELARFRFAIQGITMPDFKIAGMNGESETVGEGTLDGTTLWGNYTLLNNSFVHPTQKTFTIKTLNFQFPVIESFIYPWMMEAVSSHSSELDDSEQQMNKALIPKVNMAVKFWGGNRTHWGMEGVKPNFCYYITGMFPVQVETVNPDMSMSGSMTRLITFAFNDFIILNSESDAMKYNLLELFGKNLGIEIVKMAINTLRNEKDKWIDKAHDYVEDKLPKFDLDDDKNKNGGNGGGGGNNEPPKKTTPPPTSPDSQNEPGGENQNKAPEVPNSAKQSSNENNKRAQDQGKTIAEVLNEATRNTQNGNASPRKERKSMTNTGAPVLENPSLASPDSNGIGPELTPKSEMNPSTEISMMSNPLEVSRNEKGSSSAKNQIDTGSIPKFDSGNVSNGTVKIIPGESDFEPYEMMNLDEMIDNANHLNEDDDDAEKSPRKLKLNSLQRGIARSRSIKRGDDF